MGPLRGFTLAAAAMLFAVAGACGGTGDVALSGDVTTGTAPLRVVFSNLSEGGDRFTWDFGDGTTQTTFDPVQTILHEFTEAGVHTVTLTAGEPGNLGGVAAQAIRLDAACAAG